MGSSSSGEISIRHGATSHFARSASALWTGRTVVTGCAVGGFAILGAGWTGPSGRASTRGIGTGRVAAGRLFGDGEGRAAGQACHGTGTQLHCGYQSERSQCQQKPVFHKPSARFTSAKSADELSHAGSAHG
jgi:hypothetical protein